MRLLVNEIPVKGSPTEINAALHDGNMKRIIKILKKSGGLEILQYEILHEY